MTSKYDGKSPDFVELRCLESVFISAFFLEKESWIKVRQGGLCLLLRRRSADTRLYVILQFCHRWQCPTSLASGFCWNLLERFPLLWNLFLLILSLYLSDFVFASTLRLHFLNFRSQISWSIRSRFSCRCWISVSFSHAAACGSQW